MSFVTFLGHHTRSLLLSSVLLALAGLGAALTLPVGLFPQANFPRVVVDLDAGSRPAAQTVQLVTRPVEEAIRTVPGVRDVRSATTRGAAQISVDFGWGRNMTQSALLVQSALAAIAPTLPADTVYDVRRMDPTVYPILAYALTSHRLSQVALKDLATYQLVPLLSGVTGLARVGVQGGATEEMQVTADPHRLLAAGLAYPDIAQAIAASNVLQATGQVQDRERLSLLLARHDLTSAANIGRVILRASQGQILHLGDVATITDGVRPTNLRVSEDGQPAVLLNIYQQPDGNAVQVAANVRRLLAHYPLPPGVRLVKWYDQSELVLQSAAAVRDAVLIGLALAALVLALFLRNLRAMLVAIMVVPITLAITVLLLRLLHQSFNIMTLGGIAAAVGLLIDDSIVMIEHIAHVAGKTAPAPRAVALSAAHGFLRPLTFSSLATVIVFVPLSFLSGVTGAFSQALSLTMAAALLISYAITALVVPVLANRMIDFDSWRDPDLSHTGVFRAHHRLLVGLFNRPALLALGLVPALALGLVAYHHVRTGFMPAVDEGGFVMDYYTDPRTAIAETQRIMRQVDALLRANPDVATFSRRLGTGLGGDLVETYHGDYFVRLKPGHRKSTPQVMADTLAAIQANVPGIRVELAQLMEDLIGDLTAVPQPIEVKLFAANPAVLDPLAPKVAAAIAKIPGVVEVNDGLQPAGAALDLDIDAAAAARNGLTPAAIATDVSHAMTGIIATELRRPDKTIGVRVRLPQALSLSQAGLAALPLRAPDGHMVRLDQVARRVPVAGQNQISRENLQPMVAVTGRIERRGIGATIADLKRVLARPGLLPPGVRYALGGLYAQQQTAFLGLAVVFVIALGAEFVLLMFLYERYALAGIIIGFSLFSTSAVFVALWLTGVALNITALMGMTMIIGIGTEMAIFVVSEYVVLRARLPAAAAAIAAAQNRLRPVSMTTLAAILTLLPLAFAVGQGSQLQQPLAIAIIAGLCLQFPLVLLAVPVLIGLADRGQV